MICYVWSIIFIRLNSHDYKSLCIEYTKLVGGDSMMNKMPYYVAYPDVEYVDEDKMRRRDAEYMKSMYPKMAKIVIPFVEEECDRLEYEGSLIYDAYPDKLMLGLMCGRVTRRSLEELDTRGQFLDDSSRIWFREMVEVLVYQEISKRREIWRKNKRRWY